MIVRPGFVHTAMTEGLTPAPFSTTPDRVAECIVAAVAKNKSIVPVTPEAHVAYHARRFVPALGRWLAARKDIIG